MGDFVITSIAIACFVMSTIILCTYMIQHENIDEITLNYLCQNLTGDSNSTFYTKGIIHNSIPCINNNTIEFYFRNGISINSLNSN